MIRWITGLALGGVALLAASTAQASDKEVARGKYLVTIISCTDCHTPGNFLGKPDMARFLGGSEVGFVVPGLGTFYGPNLTSDKATGLGNWTKAQIVTAITEGKRPDGRMLAPSMPWRSFSHLTKADSSAIAAYLQTLPPVANKVAGPFGPNEKPVGFTMVATPVDK